MNKQKDATIPTIPFNALVSRWFGRNLIRIYAVLGFTYLFIPVLYTFAFSFNDSGKSNLVWKGFTLDNWRNPCGAPEVCTALGNSIKIGLLATIFSTILGTMIAFAIGRYAFKGRSSSNLLIFLPMATPEIVLGASLLSLFLVFHINPGFWPTVIAHVMCCISFVVVTVKARIATLALANLNNRRLEHPPPDSCCTLRNLCTCLCAGIYLIVLIIYYFRVYLHYTKEG